MSQNVDLSFNSLRTRIKRSYSWQSQNYMVDDSSNRCFECSKKQLFEPMCESSHCRSEEGSVFGGWFSWFHGRQLANKWLCTPHNWLFCVVLVVRLRQDQFFWKNRWSFAWKCLVHEQLLLDLAPRSYFWGISFEESTRAYFWAIDKLCGIQREQIFQMIMQYWMYAGPTNA